jgi:hypothetical protein
MDAEWLLRISSIIHNYIYIPSPLSIYKSHGLNATTIGINQNIRLNEKIRRDYANKNNISLFNIFIGWFWYSAKLRFIEKGFLGLVYLPKWTTVNYLLLKKY